MRGPSLVADNNLLLLRRHYISDADKFVEFLADKEVTRYLSYAPPASVMEEENWIEFQNEDPDSLTWSIDYDGELIGSVGFNFIDRRRRNAGLGLMIGDKSFWGRGIGTEAVRLAINYGFAHRNPLMKIHKIKAGFLKPNHASRRIQEKLGFKRVGCEKEEIFHDGQWHDMILTELMRSDWAALQKN